MSESFTYGSVGGVGRKPGPYPAVNGGTAVRFHVVRARPAVTDLYGAFGESH